MENEKVEELSSLFKERICSICCRKKCNKKIQFSTIITPKNNPTYCVNCKGYKNRELK